MRKLLCGGLALGMGLATMPAQADVLLVSNDYDTPIYVAPGVGASGSVIDTETATVGPWNAAGWAGEYLVNRSTGNPATMSMFTLTGLVPNSAVRIGSGVLAFLESWDSTDGGGGYSPDYLDLYINGTLVASLTTNNALGTVEFYDGATVLFKGVQANGNGNYSDTLIDFSTLLNSNSFATAAGSWSMGAQARGAGWQGGTDEAWGLDDWSIYGTIAPRVAGVPEPSSWALMIGGLSLVGAAVRRRKTSVAFA